MAPFLRFNLDAKKKVPPAARLAGISDGQMAWGLLEMWEYCWGTKSDVVSDAQLGGFFGCEWTRAAAALSAFGFTQRLTRADTEHGHRVCGAKEYLGLSAARKLAGKARAATAKRAEGGRFGDQQKPPTVQQPASKPPASDQLLHPSTHLPIYPSTQEAAAEAGEPPKSAPAETAGADFAAWAQEARLEAFPNALPEYPPRAKFDAWHPEAFAQLGGDLGRLKGAWLAYLRDEWAIARSPPCPWALFFATWPKHVPGQRAQGGPGSPPPPPCACCGTHLGYIALTWGHPLCVPCCEAWRVDILESADPLVHADLQTATNRWVAEAQ